MLILATSLDKFFSLLHIITIYYTTIFILSMKQKNNFEITVNKNILEFLPDEDKTLLEFLLENKIAIKSNCEGNCACGKCHVSFDEEHYDKMEISDREQDVLDGSINLTATSRLACQVKLTGDLNGAVVEVVG